MKIKYSIGVIVECIVYESDSYVFLVRQPNGQPLCLVSDENDLGSYLSELRQNVIAQPKNEVRAAVGE